ncbi:MAG: hypothetical protein ACT6RN_20060 [Agrobacterium sp.]|uniref:hypothetical protein n=1 Tax=Agrobacterium sp. TaxID=361 RepID=UPI004034790E
MKHGSNLSDNFPQSRVSFQCKSTPFVKIQLLRDNPTNEDIAGWRELLAQNGFALDEIVMQLSKEAPHAVALRVE